MDNAGICRVIEEIAYKLGICAITREIEQGKYDEELWEYLIHPEEIIRRNAKYRIDCLTMPSAHLKHIAYWEDKL